METVAVRNYTDRAKGVRFDITLEAVTNDIAHFPDEQISADERCQKWPGSLEEEVRIRLLADARGGV